MDIAAQQEWRQALGRLEATQRASLYGGIEPIRMAGKDATVLAAPVFLTGTVYDKLVQAAQRFVDVAVAIETHETFQKGNVLFDRLYESLSVDGKVFIERACRPRKGAVRRRLRRLDGFVTSEGGPMFIEMNQSAPLAISFYERARGYVSTLANATGCDVGVAPDLYQALAKWFLAELQAIGHDSRAATIAVSLETGYPAKFVDLPVACRGIQEAAKDMGVSLSFVLAEPTKFSLSPLGRPLVGGEPFDLLWRNTVYLKNYAEILDDYAEIRYGGAPMVNDLWAWFFRSKEFFAMIWDDSLKDEFELLSIDTAALRAITPQTWSVGAVASALELDKDRWVLKRCDDGFGRGIVFGSDITHEEWRRYLEGAYGRDWVAQKIVEPVTVTLPVVDAAGRISDASYQCDFDPYVVDGVVSGILVRALPESSVAKKMNIVEGAAVGVASVRPTRLER